MSRSPDRATLAAAAREYRRTHWGHPGDYDLRALPSADPREVAVELGRLVAVVYETTKGRGRPVRWYEHDFGEPLPVLGYGLRSGVLVVLGGQYQITRKGIEG